MDTIEQTTQEKRLVERGPGLASGLRDLPKHLGIKTMSAGLVAAIFGCADSRLAAEIIAWEKLRHLAVEDEKSRLVGLLSARAVHRHLEKHPLDEGGGDVPVADLMQRDLVTVTPDTLTLDAIALARKKKIGVLPVVQDGHLVAMLDEAHLQKFAANVIRQESTRERGK